MFLYNVQCFKCHNYGHIVRECRFNMKSGHIARDYNMTRPLKPKSTKIQRRKTEIQIKKNDEGVEPNEFSQT